MRNNRSAGALLVTCEIVVLVVVFVLIFFGPFSNQKREQKGTDWKTNQESVESDTTNTENMFQITENEVDTDLFDANAPTENRTSDDTENTEAEEVSKEERILFSQEVENKLSDMTTEEMVAQLFVVTTEQLTNVGQATVSGKGTRNAIEKYPVAGLVYDTGNIVSEKQIKDMISNAQGYMKDRLGMPLFLVTEEYGGTDGSQIANALKYEAQNGIDQAATEEEAVAIASGISTYLTGLGVNLNLAGDLQGATEDRTAIYTGLTDGYQEAGVATAFRTTLAENERSMIKQINHAGNDILVIRQDADTSLAEDANTPCMMSAKAIRTLRKELDETCILMTDDLSAVTEGSNISEAEMAVASLQAGMDLIYMPADFQAAYEAVAAAVKDGSIDEVRLHNAVGRVLAKKFEMME